jgi:hypothetical protein
MAHMCGSEMGQQSRKQRRLIPDAVQDWFTKTSPGPLQQAGYSDIISYQISKRSSYIII